MNDKRALLVETALDLFYRKGINSVGINEVLTASGVAKKTLYHHFSGKEALVLATLEERDKRFLQWLEPQLKGSDSDQELVEKLFGALTIWFHNRAPELADFQGCFFINTSAEFPKQESEISGYCAKHKQNVRQLISRYLSSGNPALLDMICMLKEGAIVSAYTCNDLDAAEKCIGIILESGLVEKAD